MEVCERVIFCNDANENLQSKFSMFGRNIHRRTFIVVILILIYYFLIIYLTVVGQCRIL